MESCFKTNKYSINLHVIPTFFEYILSQISTHIQAFKKGAKSHI